MSAYSKIPSPKDYEHYEVLGETFWTKSPLHKINYASTQEPPDSEEESELGEDFLNTGVHIDTNLEMEMNDDVASPTANLG